MESVSKIAFLANKAFYDACIELKGNVDASKVDFDSYAYFELQSVPSDIDFGSRSKTLENPKVRVKELSKYLCFLMPEDLDLNIYEKKESKAAGFNAVIRELAKYNIESRIRWSFRD